MRYTTGDRVKVVQLIKDEPCSDVDVLLEKVGTVVDPDCPDKDWDGNPVVRVQVLLDEEVSLGGQPPRYDSLFLFDPAELEAVQK
jgi:hypothetical protein